MFTDFRFDEVAIAAYERRCRHFEALYNCMVTEPTEDSGLSKASVFNSISQFPNVTRLLTAGL